MRENKEYCPHCNANLQGKEIPKDKQHLYGATHFSRKIGHENPYIYDGVIQWHCPDCKCTWPAANIKEWIEYDKDNGKKPTR